MITSQRIQPNPNPTINKTFPTPIFSTPLLGLALVTTAFVELELTIELEVELLLVLVEGVAIAEEVTLAQVTLDGI